MMGRIWIENEGLGLFRARKKNSRKWLEGYYVRVSETAGSGIPAVRHTIIFQKPDGSGRICRVVIFEHDVVRSKIWDEDVIGEVVWANAE